MPGDPTDEHGLPLWPAAERNKQPIADVLRAILPESGVLLEIASGTGQHALHFAAALPGWTIQPSDFDAEHLDTLRRRVALAENPRLLPPLELDVTTEPGGSSWRESSPHASQPSASSLSAVESRASSLPTAAPTAIYCANMLHIAPWSACLGLFRVAGRLLDEGGLLITYGPYSVHGAHTAESNARFDQSLRERNPEWGVRDVDAVEAVAGAEGFELARTEAMPANNLLLVWRLR